MAARIKQAEQGDKVTNATLVNGILRRAMDQRALLTITIPDTRGAFNSAILEIDGNAQFLLLDELNPKEGHYKFIAAKRLNARAMVKGVEIRFSTSLQETLNESGIACYRVNFPAAVWQLQRRQSFRVTIGLSRQVPVQLQAKDGSHIKALIHNISASGIGMLLPDDTHLEKGTILPHCIFNLGDGCHIDTQIEIRYSGTRNHTQGVYAGARFYNMDKADKRTLSRQVAKLQRELIQTLPRDQLV